MADAILIFPKTGFDIGAGVAPPFSILALAAEVQDSFKVKIIDQRTDSSWENTLKNELKNNTLCVGISSMSGYQILFALKAAKIVRENSNVPIIWGGVHPTLLSEQTLADRNVDIVVRREGEKTFAELLAALKNGKKDFKDIKGLSYIKDKKIVHNEERPFMDLNTIKDTPWHLVNIKDYIHSGVVVKDSKRELDIGETSRGCPHRCAFCYNSVFNQRRWRAMSAENAIKKILDHVEKFNLDVVWLRDDEFFVDMKRAETVAAALKKEKLGIYWYTSGIRIDTVSRMSDSTINLLKESGCEGFRFGVESGCPRILKLIRKDITLEQVFNVNKRMKKHGIAPHYSFMVGFPSETVKEALETVAVMKKLKKENPLAHMHGVNMFTPYPGTALFELAIKYKLKIPKTLEGWSKFHHLNNYAIHLSKEEREVITNIADMSYFTSDSMLDAIPTYMKTMLWPATTWLKFRWGRGLFKYTPEIQIMKFVRDKVMA